VGILLQRQLGRGSDAFGGVWRAVDVDEYGLVGHGELRWQLKDQPNKRDSKNI
jgi:hypothetical protein